MEVASPRDFRRRGDVLAAGLVACRPFACSLLTYTVVGVTRALVPWIDGERGGRATAS